MRERRLPVGRFRYSFSTPTEPAYRELRYRVPSMRPAHQLEQVPARGSPSRALWYLGQSAVGAIRILDGCRAFSFGDNLLDYLDRLMAVTAADTVCGEVRSIQSEDFASLQGFSGRDHGVRQVHRMVRIPFHQLKGTRETQAIEEPHRKASPLDELAHPVRADTLRLQHVKGFGEYGDRGTQPFP
jgi:hypothetical protein